MEDERNTENLLPHEVAKLNARLSKFQHNLKGVNRAISAMHGCKTDINRDNAIAILKVITDITNQPQKALTMIEKLAGQY
jgi:hypothetical protein